MATCVYMFLGREYHDFLQDCRIRDSASAAIGRRWKTSRQIYKQILALKEVSQSIFLFRRRLKVPQAAQAHYLWVRASEVIWSEYTRIISVLSDAK